MVTIGVPKEVMDGEYRVSIVPSEVKELVESNCRVLVQKGAGAGSGFSDGQYVQNGANLAITPAEIFDQAQIVVKVKEPVAQEYELLHEGIILFTFLHLSSNEGLTHTLMQKKVTAIAYESVELSTGTLPLLTPMSEVAGRLSIQIAAHFLEKGSGGCGKLLGGVPGVTPCTVVIIGAGTVGTNAAQIALGMGAKVTIIDIDLERLRYLDQILHGNFVTLSSNISNIAEAVRTCDVLIGAVLVHGGRAPQVVTREMISSMKPGSIVVDVAIDQGGCIATSRPTSHTKPTYSVDGVIHYCVTNIPALVPRTSTQALSNATLPYVLNLANKGFVNAVKDDEALAKGVNVHNGHITCFPVAKALGLTYTPLAQAL